MWDFLDHWLVGTFWIKFDHILLLFSLQFCNFFLLISLVDHYMHRKYILLLNTIFKKNDGKKVRKSPYRNLLLPYEYFNIPILWALILNEFELILFIHWTWSDSKNVSLNKKFSVLIYYYLNATIFIHSQKHQLDPVSIQFSCQITFRMKKQRMLYKTSSFLNTM